MAKTLFFSFVDRTKNDLTHLKNVFATLIKDLATKNVARSFVSVARSFWNVARTLFCRFVHIFA